MDAPANFVLDNVSKQMAESMRDEIRDGGLVSQADGEDAMSAVVAAIRDMETAATLLLLPSKPPHAAHARHTTST